MGSFPRADLRPITGSGSTYPPVAQSSRPEPAWPPLHCLSSRPADLLGQVEIGMTTVHSCRTKSFVCVVVITRRSRVIGFLFALQSRVPFPRLSPLASAPLIKFVTPAAPLRRRGGSALLLRLSSRTK